MQTLVKHVGTLSTRLSAVQSHIEDQLAKQIRPLYDRCESLFLSHDDLVGPMEPVVKLFALGGQTAAESRKNNQKVAGEAVAKAKAESATPGTTTEPGTSAGPGTTTGPGTSAAPGTGAGTVATPVKAAHQATAHKKVPKRG